MLRQMSSAARNRIGATSALVVLALAASCGQGSPKTNPAASAGNPTTAGAGATAGNASGGGTSSVGGGSAGSKSAGAGSGGAGAGASAGDGGGNPTGAAGSAGAANPAAGSVLSIYWVDVEGGAATIIAAPNGQTIVVDAGWAGARDAGRIAKVLADEVQAQVIDYFIATHYHTDHIGGVPTLAGLLPITKFYDHGATLEPSKDFDNYVTAAGNKRVTSKPGDKLDLGELRLTFVTSASEVIEPPLPPGAANPLCSSSTTKNTTSGIENAESLGFVATFGKFKFVDLGDLTWNVEQKLMCPNNRIGTADIYQVSHHGQDISGSPQLVHALAPTVAVMNNNGATKGGAADTFDILKASPGLQDTWSLHRVTGNDAEHNAADDLTANLTGTDQAHFIKAVVDANGSYTLTNSRNGMTRTYASR